MYINTTPISHHTNNDHMMIYNNACTQPKYYTTHPHIAQCVRQRRAWSHARSYNQTNCQYCTSKYAYIRTFFGIKMKKICKTDIKKICQRKTTVVTLSFLKYAYLTTTPFIPTDVSYAIQHYLRYIILRFESEQ